MSRKDYFGVLAEHRFELGADIGPCTEDEATALAEAILSLPEFVDVHGGAVSMTRLSVSRGAQPEASTAPAGSIGSR